MLDLAAALLRRKECGGSDRGFADFPVSGDTLTEQLGSWTAAQRQRALDDLLDTLADDPLSLLATSGDEPDAWSPTFRGLLSFVKYIASGDGSDDTASLAKLLDVLVSVLREQAAVLTTVAERRRAGAAHAAATQETSDTLLDADRLKALVESLVFILSSLAMVAERQATSKTATRAAALPSTSAKRAGKVGPGKGGRAGTNKDDWNWQREKIHVLRTMLDLAQRPLGKIWCVLNDRAPFVSMFVDTANLMLETELNVKDEDVRKVVFAILATSIAEYDQTHDIQTAVMQNLRYSTFLAEPMADFVVVVHDQYECEHFADGLIRELGQLEFDNDDKAAKEFSKFLVRLAHAAPRLLNKNLSLLMGQFDSESYAIRCAMTEVVGTVMAKNATAEKTEQSRQRAVNLCEILEERVMDISSYCRVRILKTIQGLCDVEFDPVDSSSNMAATEIAPRRGNVIPLERRQHVVRLVVGRLNDKASMVRKEACRAITTLMTTHPFWLDGGLLSAQTFQQKLDDVNAVLDNLVGVDDSVSSVDESVATFGEKQYAIEAAVKKRHYYEDAIAFTSAIQAVIPVMCKLLASTVKSDAVEAIQFFVEAERCGLAGASAGTAKMLHLIWAKDTADNESKSIRECVLNAYHQLYVEVPATTPKDQAKLIVRNLVTLTFHRTLADLISLEQLLGLMMKKELLSDEVIHHLWVVFGTTKQDIPIEQRRGAIIVLGMLANDTPEFLADHVNLMAKIGLSPSNLDLMLARYTCIAFQKLVPNSGRKGSAPPEQAYRWERDHPIFQRVSRLLLKAQPSMDWFAFAEQAVNMLYALADQPSLLCREIVRALSKRVFGTASQSSFELARLFFLVGHIAIKEIVHLEIIETEMKRRRDKSQKAAAMSGGAAGSKDDMDGIVGSVEDSIGEAMITVRERELLFGENSLLAFFLPMVRAVCTGEIPSDGLLLRMAVLCLAKFMCVSEEFCEQNLALLLSLLKSSPDAGTKCNIIIALGDMVVCFNNLIEQNVSYLYGSLEDGDLCVRKNALMVLTHLILNGMVKIKGQIGLMARCVVDPSPQISDMAKLFFTELATKDNAIYNNLPDMISYFTSEGSSITEQDFRSVMRFLFSFIEKEKQSENIVEKLLVRFRNSHDECHSRQVAFCLAQLSYASEKSFKKIQEHFSLFQDKLGELFVYKCFCDIVAKAKKAAKAEARPLLDAFEQKLAAYHHGTIEKKPAGDQGLSTEVEKMDIRSDTALVPPVVTGKKHASKNPTRSTRQKRAVQLDISDDEYVDMENHNPNSTTSAS